MVVHVDGRPQWQASIKRGFDWVVRRTRGVVRVSQNKQFF